MEGRFRDLQLFREKGRAARHAGKVGIPMPDAASVLHGHGCNDQVGRRNRRPALLEFEAQSSGRFDRPGARFEPPQAGKIIP
jgi:hypothetical protein